MSRHKPLLDSLAELAAMLEAREPTDRREGAILILGWAVGVALRAGVSSDFVRHVLASAGR